MANVPGSVEWIADLVPDLEGRVGQFEVSTDDVDDELIEVFMDESRRLTGELQEGIESDDAEMVRAAAHSIKGMGGTVGLPEISVLALEIENRAKAAKLSDARPLVEALANWVANG